MSVEGSSTLRSTFQAFKKQFYRAGDAYRELVGTGSLEFKLTGTRTTEGMKMQASTTIPNEALMVRFVVNMCRFLDPSNGLYHQTVWTALQEQYAELLPADQVIDVERSIADWKRGAISVHYNGRSFLAEEIYQLLSQGEYFNQSLAVQNLLRELLSTPVLGQLLCFKFYDYTVQGYAMVSKLFDLILAVEATQEHKKGCGDGSRAINRCIYCLSTEESFTSEEHIVPEAMGNYDQVLLKGYVCDRCNNGMLALLDNELSQCPMFAWQRVNSVLHDKRGKLPAAQWNEGVLRRTGPRDILLKVTPGFDPVEVIRQRDDGMCEVRTTLTSSRKLNLRELARALAKIGLGLVALDHGQDYACTAGFDPVRAFILEGKDFSNNLLLGTFGTIGSGITIRYQTFQPEGTCVEFNIFGVTLLLNLEQRPVLELNDQLKQAGFISFPLHGDPPELDIDMRLTRVPYPNREEV